MLRLYLMMKDHVLLRIIQSYNLLLLITSNHFFRQDQLYLQDYSHNTHTGSHHNTSRRAGPSCPTCRAPGHTVLRRSRRCPVRAFCPVPCRCTCTAACWHSSRLPGRCRACHTGSSSSPAAPCRLHPPPHGCCPDGPGCSMYQEDGEIDTSASAV